MQKYYFTYGISGFSFSGGWTEVIAPTRTAACALFRLFHPDVHEGLLNCANVYDYDDFVGSEMYLHGNFGHKCREIIRCSLKVVDAT